MGVWGQRWAREKISREDLDAGVLMWDMRRRIRKECVPDRRVVIRFHFEDGEEDLRDFWLVLDEDEVDLCLEDQGHPVDLEVRTDVRTLTEVWMGDVPFGEALRRKTIRVSGPTRLRRAFPEWLGLSLFATVERAGR